MRYLNLLGYVAIPLAFVAHFFLRGHAQGGQGGWEHGGATATFVLAGLGVIPLAHLMGTATEHLSEKAGPTWGGLLNASFGNAAELIIGIIALSKGYNSIVKASLTGSILGNLLLVGGGAMIVGGWGREKQRFNASAAETSAGLLALGVAAMLFPAIFSATAVSLHDPNLISDEHSVSLGTSIVLIIVYGLGLLFTLKTHSHIFSPKPAESPEEPSGTSRLHQGWSIKHSLLMLLLASVGIAIIAELLVGSAEQMAQHLGWNNVFVGVILLAIIGNAAEHSTAIMLARHDDMDTAMTITYQSSLQIALFATPVLVLISAAMAAMHIGNARFMDLMFTPMEVVAVVLTVGIVTILGRDGETNWFEGVMLIGLYLILAIAFFFMPQVPEEDGKHRPQNIQLAPPPPVAPAASAVPG